MFPMIVSVATFLIVIGLVLSGYHAATANSPVAERLRQLVPERGAVSETRRRPRPSVLKQVLAVLGQYSLGGNENSLSRTLSVADLRETNAALLFLGARTLLSVGPALVIVVPAVSSGKPLGRALGVAAFAWAVGHVLPNSWLKRRARRRARRITEALPDSLDLTVVCLEAGLGLNATIARVGEERSTMADPLGAEFKRVTHELRDGRSREEALRALGERNGVEDLKTLAALVIQSDRLGASMAKTLRTHADLLRTKRRQRAEEAARKLPVKLLFPIAIFILPALVLMVAGPALLGIKALVKVVTKG